MSEANKDPHQELKDNKHGIITIAGVAVCVVVGLLMRNDLLFGLVMGTVFTSGLNLGGHIAKQIAANAPAEHLMPAKLFGSAISAIIVAAIILVILSIIQGAIDVSPAEGDDIIATIVKSFFDSAASLAVGAGVLAGGLTRGPAAD
ncbi:MAG: hypothetical protein OXI40_14080 [Chloroflexota bacterium]|nr:hypothetical protein [Chloroflexota bacterium]